MHTLVALLSIVLLLGCAAPATQLEESPEGAVSSDTLTVDAPLWSKEGLDAQPRLEQYARQLPPGLGYAPGVTAWRPSRIDLPDIVPGATPGALLIRLMGFLPQSDGLGEEVWEQTVRIFQYDEGRAVGVVLMWGMKDDAIVGQDLRVWMVRSGADWHVERLEERFHCGRGVSEDDLCM